MMTGNRDRVKSTMLKRPSSVRRTSGQKRPANTIVRTLHHPTRNTRTSMAAITQMDFLRAASDAVPRRTRISFDKMQPRTEAPTRRRRAQLTSMISRRNDPRFVARGGDVHLYRREKRNAGDSSTAAACMPRGHTSSG